jgi:16S rRNA (cytosine967-C5)-methyltransferase
VIQDEGSQLVAKLIGSDVPDEGRSILDCCAAPGGKTLAIADQNPNSSITAVELHPHRARLLQKLLHPHASRIQIVNADAQHLPVSSRFDRVLADVPCSGTGTLARNPEIKWRLTFDDFGELAQRQLAILRSALAQVAPGGRLIYSTCSLEREENEDVIAQALAENSAFRLIDCRKELELLKTTGDLTWPDAETLTRGSYLRTIPGMHPCDGFFAAMLERPSG